jgi:ABC-2 type transport system ATP-binding protein
VCQPEILLLDEPYTGLDYDSTDFFNNYLKQFKEKGGTILLISHQIETCYENSDSFLILDGGVIKDRYTRADVSYEQLILTYQKNTTGSSYEK